MSTQPATGRGSAAHPARDTAGARRTADGRERRSPLLGITAFLLAMLILLALPVAMVVVNQPDFLNEASTISSRVVAGQLVAMIVAGGLALVAVLTRRGRSWGLGALALLLGLLAIGLLLPLVVSLVTGGTATAAA